MRFDIITSVPEAFRSYLSVSILARAQAKGLIRVCTHNLRDFARDKHRSIDDRPYGGGAGMVMRADVAARAIASVRASGGGRSGKTRVILLTPQGKPFDQKAVRRLVRYGRLILLSGRYEGFDERIRGLVDEEISLGDFVLTGGELPAMAVVDAVARLVPGVLGKSSSLDWESFSRPGKNVKKFVSKQIEIPNTPLLEYPQYTRPEKLKIGRRTLLVPEVLRGGNHSEILAWRVREALRRTRKRRPDLLKSHG